MPSKILRMVVDQRHQVFHQLTQGPVPRESGDDDQQARVAASQYLQRPDLALAHRIVASNLPQALAILGCQRFQADDPEHLEKWLLHIVQGLEPAGGGGKQDDLGFRLECLTQYPA